MEKEHRKIKKLPIDSITKQVGTGHGSAIYIVDDRFVILIEKVNELIDEIETLKKAKLESKKV